MSTNSPRPSASASRPLEHEAYWFIGQLAIVRASAEATGGQLTLFELLVPEGAGSPMHVHRREEEWFSVMDGEVTFWVDGKVIKAGPGSFVWGPRNVPHTFLVTQGPARMLVGVQPGGFEGFVRSASVPARSLTIPGPDVPMPDPAKLAAEAAAFGVEILGPPGIPE